MARAPALRSPRPDLLALIEAVREQPDDDLPRLVLADWLEENGEVAKAEDIRRSLGANRNTPRAAKADLARLDVWFGSEFRDHGIRVVFCGGLPHVAMALDTFLSRKFQHWPTSESFALLNGLTLTQADGEQLARLAERPELVSLGHLDVETQDTPRGVDATPLLACPYLRNLRRLAIFSTVGPVLQTVGRNPALVKLNQLHVAGPRLGSTDEPYLVGGRPRGLEAFLASSSLPSLERLTLSGRLDAGEFTELVRSNLLRRLVRLVVMGNDVGDPGVSALGLLPVVRLRELGLINSGLTTVGAIRLAEMPTLGELTRLDVSDNQQIGPAGRLALRSTFGDRLRL